jgi:hypothetical protein
VGKDDRLLRGADPGLPDPGDRRGVARGGAVPGRSPAPPAPAAPETVGLRLPPVFSVHDQVTHWPALVRRAHCTALTAGRTELQGYARAGLPACCGMEMDLYILAENPKPEDKEVVALPVPLPGSDDGTAIIPAPQPRKPAG